MNSIVQFRGVDAHGADGDVFKDDGEYTPEEDPRANHAEVVRAGGLIGAVDALEPAATTSVFYADVSREGHFDSLDDLQERVRGGEVDLTDVLTETGRFNALVNPRRSESKKSGEMDSDSDRDLWHVPTDSYQVIAPAGVFTSLARVIDDEDDIPNDAVFGEFRTYRDGGRVHGEILFDTMQVTPADGDPVKLGIEVGWDYFGSTAFYIQPFAQQTSCRNSMRAIGSKDTVMHHNKSVDWGEKWRSKIGALVDVGSEVRRLIEDASEVRFDFRQLPVTVEGFVEYAGLPARAAGTIAERARERAAGSPDPEESPENISAFSMYRAATYWLTWYWDGSESSQAFRRYRRASNDVLMNPAGVAERVERAYESAIEEGAEQGDEEAVARIRSLAESIEERVEEFESVEERLDRIDEAMEVGHQQ